ncbi:hypothetical protein MD484_g2425, partial [Candolleomyces efflorescens]
MSIKSAPYPGPRRKLVLAFDIGTTYSGISYSILDPGQVPEIKSVNRFPGHEQIRGESKIPTMIYYDNTGAVRAVGAEAMREGISETALDEGWTKSEWFKLHIRPKAAVADSVTAVLPPLPPGKNVVQVLADFLQYFRNCAMIYIKGAHPNGEDLWRSVSSDIEYVISHPNGWEGYQQSQIRRAVVLAGLIPDSPDGNSRVTFVTEGEASLHFAIDYGFPATSMKAGEGVIIVDAGGGTVDISAYRKKEGGSCEFEETAIPQCHFFGSVYVSVQAKVFLNAYLKESDFHEDLDHIVRCFDKSTKVRFQNEAQMEYIKFGGTRDNDPSCDIRYGQLKIPGAEVAKFFRPSVTCVVTSVLNLIHQVRTPFKYIVLVGGFSASEWLVSKVDEALKPHSLSVIRPDNPVNKAVSDGAVSFYLNRCVRVRVAKMPYGIMCNQYYYPEDHEHRARSSKLIKDATGELFMSAYSPGSLTSQNAPASDEDEFSRTFWHQVSVGGELASYGVDIWCYQGQQAHPRWKDSDEAMPLANPPANPRIRPAAPNETSTSKPERSDSRGSRPVRKSTMESSCHSEATRDSQSKSTTTNLKDFNRGDMKSGNTGEGEKGVDEQVEDKSRKRTNKDKAFPQLPSQETNERSSTSSLDRSGSPLKRKPVPTESNQFQEPHRSLLVELLDPPGMESDSGSDMSDDAMFSSTELEEVDTEMLERPGSRATLPAPRPQPVTNQKELDVEEELVAAARVAAIAEQSDKEQRDHAIAKQLDHELNRKNEEGCMPGEFEAGETAQHGQRSSMRSVASNLWHGTPESQLEKAKVKIQGLKKRFDDMEATAYHYQKLHHQERSQHVRTYNQARMLEMEFNSARKHIHAQDEELKSVRNELAAVKQQLSDAVNLSEVRGKELKGAQVFLTKADTLSVTDVVQKVSALNEEIFQMAAYLGEVLVYEVLEPEADRQEHRQAAIKSTYDRALGYLGETLANALAQHSVIEPKEESNPLLVQIIMQIALTNWCGGFGNRWTSYEKVEETAEGQPKESSSKQPSISKQADHNRFVSELYNSIRDHEDQAVAGRWRSLTKAHIPFSTSGWDHHLMVTICAIMGVAGWATRSNDEMIQVEKRLGSIFKPLLELRKATGEDVTSADLEISIIQSGQTFDPSYMEDAYADGRASSKSKKSAPEQVINTSGLGLQKVVVKRLKGGAVQKQLEILSMPKVVLEKTIKEALEPPPPSRKKSSKKPNAADAGGAPGLFSGLLG